MLPLVSAADVVRVAYITEDRLRAVLTTSSWQSCVAHKSNTSNWDRRQCFELLKGSFIATEVNGKTLLLQVRHAAFPDNDGSEGWPLDKDWTLQCTDGQTEYNITINQMTNQIPSPLWAAATDNADALFEHDEWDSLVESLQLQYQQQVAAYSYGDIYIELTQAIRLCNQWKLLESCLLSSLLSLHDDLSLLDVSMKQLPALIEQLQRLELPEWSSEGFSVLGHLVHISIYYPCERDNFFGTQLYAIYDLLFEGLSWVNFLDMVSNMTEVRRQVIANIKCMQQSDLDLQELQEQILTRNKSPVHNSTRQHHNTPLKPAAMSQGVPPPNTYTPTADPLADAGKSPYDQAGTPISVKSPQATTPTHTVAARDLVRIFTTRLSELDAEYPCGLASDQAAAAAATAGSSISPKSYSAKVQAALKLTCSEVQDAATAIIRVISSGKSDAATNSSSRDSAKVLGEHLHLFALFSPDELHRLLRLPDLHCSEGYTAAAAVQTAAHQTLAVDCHGTATGEVFVQRFREAWISSYNSTMLASPHPSGGSSSFSSATAACAAAAGTVASARSSSKCHTDVTTTSSISTFDPAKASPDAAFDVLADVDVRTRFQLHKMFGGDETHGGQCSMRGSEQLQCLHALYHTPSDLDAVVLCLLRFRGVEERSQISQQGLERLRKFAAEYVENLAVYSNAAKAVVSMAE